MSRFKGLKVDKIKLINNSSCEGVKLLWSGHIENEPDIFKGMGQFGEYGVYKEKDTKKYIFDSECMDEDGKTFEFLEYLINDVYSNKDNFSKDEISYIDKVKTIIDRS